jgi:hypothetical protein
MVVILFGAIGAGYAAMTAQTNSVENNFDPGEITCQVSETFDGTTKTNVAIKHDGGSICAFVRAEIVVTWKSEDGKSVYGYAPVLGVDYTLSLNNTDWFEADDGFYYCKSSVDVGDTSPVLIYSVAPTSSVVVPDGFKLSVEIIAQAIQANPPHAVTDAWPAVICSGNELEKASNN